MRNLPEKHRKKPNFYMIRHQRGLLTGTNEFTKDLKQILNKLVFLTLLPILLRLRNRVISIHNNKFYTFVSIANASASVPNV